jgi:hypothetical protein
VAAKRAEQRKHRKYDEVILLSFRARERRAGTGPLPRLRETAGDSRAREHASTYLATANLGQARRCQCAAPWPRACEWCGVSVFFTKAKLQGRLSVARVARREAASLAVDEPSRGPGRLRRARTRGRAAASKAGPGPGPARRPSVTGEDCCVSSCEQPAPRRGWRAAAWTALLGTVQQDGEWRPGSFSARGPRGARRPRGSLGRRRRPMAAAAAAAAPLLLRQRGCGCGETSSLSVPARETFTFFVSTDVFFFSRAGI